MREDLTKRASRRSLRLVLAAGALGVTAGALGLQPRAAVAQNANNAPVFTTPTPTAPVNGILGAEVSFTVTAQDSDPGNAVNLTVEGLPPGANQDPVLPAQGNPVSSRFSWVPTPGDEGIYELTYTASDGSSEAKTTVFLLIERVGTCADGATGGAKGVVFNSSVGWPGGLGALRGFVHAKNLKTKKQLIATSITGMTSQGNVSTVQGLAKINGRGSVQFEMSVQDNGAGTRDKLLHLIVGGKLWARGRLVRKGKTKPTVHFHTPVDGGPEVDGPHTH